MQKSPQFSEALYTARGQVELAELAKQPGPEVCASAGLYAGKIGEAFEQFATRQGLLQRFQEVSQSERFLADRFL